jgi:energy-coupling factor transporter transmembrane protein EcfT
MDRLFSVHFTSEVPATAAELHKIRTAQAERVLRFREAMSRVDWKGYEDLLT